MVIIDTAYITPEGMLAGAIVPMVLSVLAVGARFWVRRLQRLSIWWDDWLLVPALVFLLVQCLAIIIGVGQKAVGYPYGIPPGAPPTWFFTNATPNYIALEKIRVTVQTVQILGVGFTKASFIMFYRRIFCHGTHSVWISRATWAVFILNFVWMMAFFFMFVFVCGAQPWKQWDTVVESLKYCPNQLNFDTGLAISDFIIDVIVIALPVPMIWRLNMGGRQKLLVLGVFALGGVALAASTIRMSYFIIQSGIGYDPTEDGDIIISLYLFWSVVENGAGIVAACLPTLRYLLHISGLRMWTRQSKTSGKMMDDYGPSPSGYHRSAFHSGAGSRGGAKAFTPQQREDLELVAGRADIDHHVRYSVDSSLPDRPAHHAYGIEVRQEFTQAEDRMYHAS